MLYLYTFSAMKYCPWHQHRVFFSTGDTSTVPECCDGIKDGQDPPVHRQWVHQDRAHADGASRRSGDHGHRYHHGQHHEHLPSLGPHRGQRDVPPAEPAAELCGPEPEQPQRPQRGTHLALTPRCSRWRWRTLHLVPWTRMEPSR